MPTAASSLVSMAGGYRMMRVRERLETALDRLREIADACAEAKTAYRRFVRPWTTVELPQVIFVGSTRCDNSPHLKRWLFHERCRHINQMQQLSSNRSKEKAADPSKPPGAHEDMLNVLLASHAIDRCCNTAPLGASDVINSCLAAGRDGLF
jgi:hypothetical protein